MSPLAKGLFHAAVDMSGSYIYNATLEQAEVDNLAFLNKTGCGDLACLRRLSIGQVLQVGGGGGRQSILTGEPCCKKSVKGNEAITVIKKSNNRKTLISVIFSLMSKDIRKYLIRSSSIQTVLTF